MRTFLVCILLLTAPIFLVAQITLERQYLPLPGASSVVVGGVDSSYLAGLDLTAAGGGQIWDFSRLIPLGRPDTLYYLPPSQTAFAGNFPDANLAVKDSSSQSGSPVYYFRLTESQFEYMGLQDPDMSRRNLEPERRMFFPFSFQSEISQSLRFLLDTGAFEDTASVEQRIRADAWGQVITPLGRFECLRLKRERREQYRVFGLPVTVENTIYEFWTREFITPVFVVDYQRAELFGGEDEFLEGQYLIDQNILNATRRALSAGYRLQVFPNPASGLVTVSFELERRQRVQFDIWDSQGRRLRQLDLGDRPAGKHQVVLELRGLPPGVYRIGSAGEVIGILLY